ncbi:hypothetical protein DFH07DRAFT_939852 [Mycena maculata]|uniref:Uncharacterized protein n=1 Tax=Mycena maculata TaxID=230809 RepID=A0AAD7NHM9_9AGAR|nr:hypothetical protein DFH07DRAFT_939852 [Mycena maculata]
MLSDTNLSRRAASNVNYGGYALASICDGARRPATRTHRRHRLRDQALEFLKEFALTASPFRETCQRILLSAVKLKGSPVEKYQQLHDLFVESPRIGGYITRFHLAIWPLPDVQLLRDIFSRLFPVRSFTFEGAPVRAHLSWPSWDSVAPVASAVIEFMQRPNVASLYIRGLVGGVPPDVLQFLLCSVQSLSFGVLPSDGNDSIKKGPPTPPILQQLVINRSDDICGAIARPEFAVSLANVRQFGRTTMHSDDNSLIDMMAHNLEHIFLYYTPVDAHILSLPPLGALRTISLRFRNYNAFEWLLASLSTIASCSCPPNLEEISIIFPISYHPSTPFPFDAMGTLDRQLAVSPRVRRFIWLLNYWDRNLNRGAIEEYEVFVEQGLPTLNAQGRLIVGRWREWDLH